MFQYYAPKNFNFWYYLRLAGAAGAGDPDRHRHLPDDELQAGRRTTLGVRRRSNTSCARCRGAGWSRYMHSTGASAFFVVVYLHMFRGLLYGSYRKPRELVWIFGCLIFLCLMAEAFMGYLLPWGQMSYWGAQVIVNLFSAIPVIGQDLSLFIRGDYVVCDATLNRFFSFHVIAVPLVLLGLVVAHIIALHEVGSEQPGRRRDQGEEGPRTASRSMAFRSTRTTRCMTCCGVGGFLLFFSAVIFFFAGSGRLLPRSQQLLPGRSAEDAAAHRAGLVLHAVLFDAARHDAELPAGAVAVLRHRAGPEWSCAARMCA